MDQFKAMTISQLSKWENLCRCHPAPWYLEQCNAKGVEVKDNEGNTVFSEDFGTIPDEMPSSLAESIRTGSAAFALWLVAYAEDPHGKGNS